MLYKGEPLSSRPVFGFQKPGCIYKPRPGAYAVIFNHQAEIATIEYRGSYFLPGGGIHPGELAEEALQREAVEECGWSIVIGSLIGEAIDYIAVRESGPFYEIQSRFYRADFLQEIGNPIEAEHQLVWLPVREASLKLRRQSQAWVVSLILP